MKKLNPAFGYILLLILAVGLTLVSLRFVRPVGCRSFCDAPTQDACPSGSCRPFEQRAGLPLPVLIDDPAGSSPTGGWGILGPEDLPNPLFFLLDVLFYSVLFWLLAFIVGGIRGKERSIDLLAIGLPVVWVLLGLLCAYVFYAPFLNR